MNPVVEDTIFFRLKAILLLSLITAGSAAAIDRPNGPVGFIESPLYKATGGLFRADADDSIDPARYRDIDMIKEIIVISFHDTRFGTFGYGRYFGGLYIAAYYNGNLLRGYYNDTYTEYEEAWNGGRKTFKLYDSVPEINEPGNNNRFALLIGTGNMGFRLSYASTFDSFNGSDITFNQLFYRSYKTASGWIVPELQWAMTVPLTKRGIQPKVTFDLGIKKEYTRNELYDPADFSSQNEELVYSMNFIQPSLSLGLGGFTAFSKPGFDAKVDLDYTFSLKFYSNDYNYENSGGVMIASIKGINTGTVLTENSFSEHCLTPAVMASFTGMERLKFRGCLSLPMTFVSCGETGMSAANGELHKQGDDISLTVFQFSPALKIGFQYRAVPEKLDLNAGGVIQFASITKAVSGIRSYTDGVEDEYSKKRTTYTNYGKWNPGGNIPPMGTNGNSSLFAGLTFMFNEKFLLDTMMGFYTENTDDSDGSFMDIWGRNLGSFSGILLSLKI